ncbi:hypothetical protein RCL_jg4433.t1 [Rhizophagus clarus]|uniref:Uncharacterized protein n=1 Tax=Rhizophagus clarus TaxID=94130 RepID=A0A8H3KSJ7_9GLOM|nr:hypothetical protein RCL_jg4433.t1 [Rhizophagus clarus]
MLSFEIMPRNRSVLKKMPRLGVTVNLMTICFVSRILFKKLKILELINNRIKSFIFRLILELYNINISVIFPF